MNSVRRLGRGLDSLIPRPGSDNPTTPPLPNASAAQSLPIESPPKPDDSNFAPAEHNSPDSPGVMNELEARPVSGVAAGENRPSPQSDVSRETSIHGIDPALESSGSIDREVDVGEKIDGPLVFGSAVSRETSTSTKPAGAGGRAEQGFQQPTPDLEPSTPNRAPAAFHRSDATPKREPTTPKKAPAVAQRDVIEKFVSRETKDANMIHKAEIEGKRRGHRPPKDSPEMVVSYSNKESYEFSNRPSSPTEIGVGGGGLRPIPPIVPILTGGGFVAEDRLDGTEGAGPAMTANGVEEALSVRMAPVDWIVPNVGQPRREFSESSLQSLARSILRNGILQPIIVRERRGSAIVEALDQRKNEAGGGEAAARLDDGDVHYEIVAGERRWRAAKLAGLHSVPVAIRKADEEQMCELALVENIQREDLSPIERATGYMQLCRRFGMSAEEVAKRIGEDRSTVLNYMRLLELPIEIQEMVGAGAISAGHGRALAGVQDSVRRAALALAVVREGLSVRMLESLIRRQRGLTPAAADVGSIAQRTSGRSAQARRLERRFEEALKTRVTIQEGKKRNTGKVVIEYYSLDDFERISAALGVDGE